MLPRNQSTAGFQVRRLNLLLRSLLDIYMGVNPKIVVFTLQNGWFWWFLYNGKPYEQMGWFGGTPIFGNIHIQEALKDSTAQKIPIKCE